MAYRTALYLISFFLVPSCVPIRVGDRALFYSDRCALEIANHQLTAAKAACEMSLEYQPEYWDALHNLGLIAQLENNNALAKKYFQQAIRKNQNMAQSWNNLGVIAQAEGRPNDSIECFERALEVNPEYTQSRRNLGAQLLSMQKYQAAEKTFRQLILTDPNIAEGHIGLGTSLVHQKDYSRAAQSFQLAIALVRESSPAWRGLAVAQMFLNDREYKASAQECLELNADDEICREMLSR